MTTRSDPHRPGPAESQREAGVLALRNSVLYPEMLMPLSVGREKSLRLIEEATKADGQFVVLSQRRPETEDPAPEELYEVGTLCRIIKLLRLADDNLNIIVQGLRRVRIEKFLQTDPYLLAVVEPVQEVIQESVELTAVTRNVLMQFERLVQLSPNLPADLVEAARRKDTPSKLADFVAFNMDIATSEKQRLLETLEVRQRLEEITRLLNKEIEVLQIGSKIQSQVMSEVGKSQREYYLREQLKAIKKELGDEEEGNVEIEELREKIQAAGMPERAREVAEKELERLARMHPSASEYTVSRTYLDWLVMVPWSKETQDKIDIREARRILEEDHYDLEKVKERILEYLAVKKVKAEMKGPILCLVGPPGVGKTSLGRSVARSLGRKFHRISLGGIRDEAEIRGHRRTYVGALPGRIIQGLRTAGTRNPVFMLDEIDKVGIDFRGDPSSALLEVLDPEQNHSFSDHYLEIPFDLSHVLFIATANVLDTIPPALRDRMEVISIPGYTEEDKLEIARRHLIPKQRNENGLNEDQITFEDEGVREIIRGYTREAGLRNLEREIATVCRKVTRRIVEEGEPASGEDGPPEDTRPAAPTTFRIGKDQLREFLGPVREFHDVSERIDRPGVATGLAWTPSGGDILFIEASRMPGRGELILTGQLGDVMKESARAALTYLRSQSPQIGIPDLRFGKSDIHIHVPAGSIPKDGPSAGIALAMALFSLLTGRIVDSEVAATGEVTLRGKVLPVGGIKEKVLAARRSGIKTVILPHRNENDLEELPAHAKQGLTFHLVDDLHQALEIAFGKEALQRRTAPPPPPPEPTARA